MIMTRKMGCLVFHVRHRDCFEGSQANVNTGQPMVFDVGESALGERGNPYLLSHVLTRM